MSFPVVEVVPDVPWRFEDNGQTIFATATALTQIEPPTFVQLESGLIAGWVAVRARVGDRVEILIKGSALMSEDKFTELWTYINEQSVKDSIERMDWELGDY